MSLQRKEGKARMSTKGGFHELYRNRILYGMKLLHLKIMIILW